MNRREFLKAAAMGMASAISLSGEVLGKEKEKTRASVKFEMVYEGNERKIVGESMDLGALHDEVANNFELIIERELKNPFHKLTVGDFKTNIARKKDGTYILEYSVQLNPAKKEEQIHRYIGMRGKIWHGVNAVQEVNRLYKEELERWRPNMYKKYPHVKFWTEESSDGDDTFYHRVCIMKGAEKK